MNKIMASNQNDEKVTIRSNISAALRQGDLLRQFLLLGIVILFIAALVWWQWPFLNEIFRNEERLSEFVEELGWFGPLALILMNTLQIVVAPIPGYFVQAAAGYLYGPFWGGVWATCGLMCGSMLAMALTRHFGRPLAVAMIGSDRLDQWELTTHSTSPWVWFLLLIAPLGDIPYFLAGLARVSYQRIALTTLFVRAPTVFAWSAIGAGVVVLEWWQLVAIFALLGVLLALFLRYQQQLMRWIDRSVHRQIQNERDPGKITETITTETITDV